MAGGGVAWRGGKGRGLAGKGRGAPWRERRGAAAVSAPGLLGPGCGLRGLNGAGGTPGGNRGDPGETPGEPREGPSGLVAAGPRWLRVACGA